MIERYSRPKMTEIWSNQNKFQKMMEVEIAVAEAQAKYKIIPLKAAQDIRKKAKFSEKRILEIEAKTKHDVIAFVSNLAENVGPSGRYIHFGLTSSDVLDTATSLLIKEAGVELMKSLKELEKALLVQCRSHKKTICTGRTHGMHAEPTSFGMKMAGHLAELRRNKDRLKQALKQAEMAKLSGAVGTYSAQDERVELTVAKALGLTPELIATQVVPRDRHAELMWSLSMIGAGLERLSVELRHLQRTEVMEVVEGFSKGQKGSSAMPHKKNPISSENITGAARLLRSYAQASMENIALWHERDISHSSVERVIFPDAFILCDYALNRMAGVVANLIIDKERMLANMNLSQGALFSSHVLLEFVNQGMSREEAYAHVQALSHGLKAGESLRDAIKADKSLKLKTNHKKMDEIFSGKTHLSKIEKVVEKVLSLKG